MQSDECIVKIINEMGVRHVIKNYKLSYDMIQRISNNEFSCLYEETDILIEEIDAYQKFLDMQKFS
jgi:hypothetical protein